MSIPTHPAGAETVLMHELAEPTERLMARHMENAKTWYPFELIPWDQAKSYEPGQAWDPGEYPLPDGVRSALYVNLLTEDNLPYYTHSLMELGQNSPPMQEWTRRWTAEEGRHSIAIREWMEATRAFDPHLLEDTRIAQVSGGVVPEGKNIGDVLAYVSFQELATNVAHRNTGAALDKERGGKKVMAHVAGDELLHHNFYRDLTAEALRIDPSFIVSSIASQLRGFKMPGQGIPGFENHAKAIAGAGIFGPVQFYEDVITPTLEAWNIDELSGLSSNAEKARDLIRKTMVSLGKIALRQKQQSQVLDA